jgi:transposase
MPRHQLTDDEWEQIQDLFPALKATGRPPRSHRQIVDAILWILRTGASWRDLSEEYGPWGTAWDLFDKCQWTRIVTRLVNPNCYEA